MGYGVYRPFLPLLFSVPLNVPHGDWYYCWWHMEILFSNFPNSVALEYMVPNTIFFTVFFIGGMENLFMVSPAVDVVATPMIGSLQHVLSSPVSSFTDKSSLQLECTLSLLLLVDTDFSSITLYIIDYSLCRGSPTII